ncbi:ATP-dependent helicase [Patescibacteria group bacterium]
MKLNKQQKLAVNHSEGPLLIIAGAGTGKTTVIAERIKHLIAKNLATPSEILALTFTEKASKEMEERVDVAMPYGYERMWIMTFHSFCDQVLRDDGMHAGFDPEFNLLTESESVQFMRNHFDKLGLDYFAPLGKPHKYARDLLTHFSRLADEDVTPRQYLQWVEEQETKNKKQATLSEEEKLEKQKFQELSSAYKTFVELKEKNGVMDFSDLISNTLTLFRKRANVLKEYRKKFKYILVDEYQDTNFTQNELVKFLAGRNGNVTVVADDDQSIYKWRGAAVSNVVQFRKSFPETKVVTLTTNYRSIQYILDCAHKLIQNNNPDRLEIVEGIDKKLKGLKKGNKKSIEFIHTNNLMEETEKIGDEIKKLVGSSYNYQYSDIAILVRANNHAKAFEHALTRAGIPNMFLGPGKLYEQPEVIDLVSFLKFLTDPDDSQTLYRLLSSNFLDINSYDLLRLSNKARRKNTKLYTYLDPKILKTHKLPKDQNSKLLEIRKMLEKYFKQINSKSAGELLYDYIESSGYLQKLVNPDSESEIDKAHNVARFFEKVRNYESTHNEKSVFAVTDWIDLSAELGESPIAGDTDWTQSDSIKLLTIHSAKGLEFPVVFLVNLVNQRFPSANRRDRIPIPDELVKEQLPEGDSHLQEERRLFYVGLTRAEDKAYLSASDFYGEGKRQTKISPFVLETLGEVVSKQLTVGSKDKAEFIEQLPANPSPITNHQSPITQLSYTQIQTYKICPLHYKLRYVLRIPTPKTSALSFGTSIHDTLEDYYKALRKGEKFTKPQIKKSLSTHWINEGYKSKTQERRSFDRAGEYLKKYYDLHKKLPINVHSTETTLNANISDGKDLLKLTGKIDRVDVTEKGLEIVDYKTGDKIPTQRDLDRDEQLTFYALLISKVRQKPYDVDLDDTSFSLYYLKEQKNLVTKRTKSQVGTYEKEIFSIKREIEKSDFKCSGNIICRDCEYRLFCKT